MQLETDSRTRRRSWRQVLVSPMFLASMGLSVGASALLVLFRELVAQLGYWGYLGVFVVMIVNNATVILPSLGHAFLVTMALSLNPYLLGLVGGLGAAIGELTGYFIGVSSSVVLKDRSRYRSMQRLTRRWGGWVLLVFAATPLPFDVAGIYAGMTRFPLVLFLVWTAAGKVISSTAFALAGYHGLSWLLELLDPLP